MMRVGESDPRYWEKRDSGATGGQKRSTIPEHSL
jgi:hypothetical protein